MSFGPLPNDPNNEDNADIQHRRARSVLLTLTSCVFFIGAGLTYVLIRHPNVPALHGVGEVPYLFPLTVVCFALSALVVLLGLLGPLFPSYSRALNDELRRAQRAKATQFGFVLAILEMCALLIAGAYRPRWEFDILPLAIATAVVLPSLYFMLLEWRSDRGDG